MQNSAGAPGGADHSARTWEAQRASYSLPGHRPGTKHRQFAGMRVSWDPRSLRHAPLAMVSGSVEGFRPVRMIRSHGRTSVRVYIHMEAATSYRPLSRLELVFGLVYGAGVEIASVEELLGGYLDDFGYSVEAVRLSDAFPPMLGESGATDVPDATRRRQDQGDRLRERAGRNAAGRLAIFLIAGRRRHLNPTTRGARGSFAHCDGRRRFKSFDRCTGRDSSCSGYMRPKHCGCTTSPIAGVRSPRARLGHSRLGQSRTLSATNRTSMCRMGSRCARRSQRPTSSWTRGRMRP
ncbi:MAG: hypothetical protein QOG56_708 [Solirubrobacteraceae bacterium]|nr:hypothetical protein [Solirubrobacteraceae bacterium]